LCSQSNWCYAARGQHDLKEKCDIECCPGMHMYKCAMTWKSRETGKPKWEGLPPPFRPDQKNFTTQKKKTKTLIMERCTHRFYRGESHLPPTPSLVKKGWAQAVSVNNNSLNRPGQGQVSTRPVQQAETGSGTVTPEEVRAGQPKIGPGQAQGQVRARARVRSGWYQPENQ
jgi:hypothetical protein